MTITKAFVGLLAALGLLFASGCKTTCRPGSVLLKVTCPANGQEVDHFRLFYAKPGEAEQELEPVPANCPTTSIDVALENYKALVGAGTMTFKVTASAKDGTEVETKTATVQLAEQCAIVPPSEFILAGQVCEAGAACVPSASPCNAGKRVCSESGASECTAQADVLPDGSSCGTGSVCFGGVCQPCDAGGTCAIGNEPCKTGKTSCFTGQPTCETVGEAPEGSPCGDGKVCVLGTCAACVEGATCVPVTDACSVGVLSCSSGTPTCESKKTPVADGTKCGAGMVCKSGLCGACNEGALCSIGNPCRQGTTTCNSGEPICVESGNVPNGTNCGSGMVCAGGACAACQAGAACVPTNPCHTGALSCSGGVPVCTDTGTSVANGQACGTDLVCNGGSCSACAAEKPCVPINTTCKVGKTSCSTGSLLCIETDKAANGSSCGAGKVCGSGECVACGEGGACTPSNPCRTGTLACSSGLPACTDSGMAIADGSACGTDRVCRTGSCISCVANQACLPGGNKCKTGKTSCATGVSACIETGSTNDGTTCGPDMVCRAGVCATCKDGTSCSPNNVCNTGTQSCSTGLAMCIDSNQPVANGTSCGTDFVCRGGACEACKAGQSCDICRNGVTSCNTGSSVCVPGQNAPNGTSCGTGMVCSGGTCGACSQNASCNLGAGKDCKVGKTNCSSGMPVCTDTGNAPDGTTCSAGACKAGVCTPPKVTVTIVRKSAQGTSANGTVTGTSGIACGTTCSIQIDSGTTLTLNASPNAGVFFSGWSGGGCSGGDLKCTSGGLTADTTIEATFAPANYIFVTSTQYSVPQLGLNGGGNPQAGADKLCQQRAAAGSATSGLGRTWISLITLGDGSSSFAAGERLVGKRGWLRPDGKPFGDQPDDFITNYKVYYPPAIDENGTWLMYGDATLGNGCLKWTSSKGPIPADYRPGGVPTAGGYGWNLAYGTPCSYNLQLYCVSIDYTATVPAPTPPGGAKIAFVTDSLFVPGGGLADADALCQLEATGKFTGTFKAFLASGGASPASRFSASGPWYRPDGVFVGAYANVGSATPRLTAPIQVTPTGRYIGNDTLWTGAKNPTDVSATANTCTNWTSTSGNGRMGSPSRTDVAFVYDYFDNACNSSGHLYCLQQ